MKIFIRVLAIAAALVAGVSFAADVQFQTGGQYDGWKDGNNNQGSQAYVPLQVKAQHKQVSVGVLTGYAYTYYDPSAGDSQSLSQMLDTKVNFAYEIMEKLPVDILLGLDFNFPSGKTALKQQDLILMMDPDLVTITQLGEGYNINPTLTIAKEWSNWVAGLGFGYVWRGKYDYSQDLRSYDPGNIFNTTAEVRFDFLPNWSARLFGNYTWYEKDQVESSDFYREGDFFLAGLGLQHTQTKWAASLTLRSLFRNKSKFEEQAGTLATEEQNSHGIEWIGDLAFKYFVNDQTTLQSYLQGLLVQDNGYPSDSSHFIGKRQKLSLGIGASRKLNQHLEVVLLVKGFVMHDDEARYPEYRSERTYQGFSAGGQLTGRF